jgi:hypothetical protein
VHRHPGILDPYESSKERLHPARSQPVAAGWEMNLIEGTQ